MRIKTMIIIIITILFTVMIMQNTDEVPFKLLFWKFYESKLVIMLAVAVVGFVIGVLISRTGKPKYIPGQRDMTDNSKKYPNTLSDEDREYIN